MNLQQILNKVNHQYGRHYGAYLTPVELIDINENTELYRALKG